MGYYGKLKEKEIAIKLRRSGLSYNEIKAKLNISKDTISRWCRDIILTSSQLERLTNNKLKGATIGRMKGAKLQQQRRLDEINKMTKQGIEEIGILSNRERFLIGTAFYAAEGTKVDGQVVFSNSDPKLIKFMTLWFNEFCNVHSSKLRGRLWIHTNREETKARLFWSDLTKIPLPQFYKSYIAENKVNSKKVRKKVHEYGVFGISYSDTKKHRQIMGWIAGITDKLIV